MGFFDNIKNSGMLNSVKNAAVKAKCASGYHAGKFEPITGMPKCELEKTCPDCDKYVTKTNHSFGEEEYVDPNICEMKKTCIHCGEASTREVHEEFKEIDKDDYCRPKEECTRCGSQRVGEPKHDWFKYAHNSTETTVEYSCLRCKKSEMRDKIVF